MNGSEVHITPGGFAKEAGPHSSSQASPTSSCSSSQLLPACNGSRFGDHVAKLLHLHTVVAIEYRLFAAAILWCVKFLIVTIS